MATLVEPVFGPKLVVSPSAPNQSIYEASTTQKHAIGSILDLEDGRRFRYTLAGGTALVQALMCQAQVYNTTDHYCEQVQTGYAKAVGDGPNIRILVTTGNVASAGFGAAENDFAGGYLLCNKVSPAVLGDTYRILASKHNSETTMDLLLASTWRTAMLATGEISLIPSRFCKTVVHPATTETAPIVGVPLCAVAAGSYYWSQTKGPAPLLVDTGDTVVIGQYVGCPRTDAVAGTCGPLTTVTTERLRTIWGEVMWIGAADEPALVNLMLE